LGRIALGHKGKYAVDIMVALTQFSFVISHTTFVYETLKPLFSGLLEYGPGFAYVLPIILNLIYFAFIMERRIEKFSFAYATGTYIILVVCVIVGTYCTFQIEAKGMGPDIIAYKDNSVWSTIGFSIYVYEGIGVLMPIMKASENKQDFSRMVIYAVVVLSVLYVSFATLCYFTYGDALNEPIILNMLP
jgi:solute carrier family 36 (proton-coupled amino acid transporter)